ncbi:hypothetical protein RB195_003634 [Necator americanus]|uniref:Uncharacterized protein n=1 Tax=Necator americanus TaxID=51031 RepID=A0ABR1DPF6_NECAM
MITGYAHLFDTTVLPALTYALENWALRKQEENVLSVIERAIERHCAINAENGLVHLSNRDCIDREKIINVIRNGTLSHDERIKKVEEMSTRESEQITKL